MRGGRVAKAPGKHSREKGRSPAVVHAAKEGRLTRGRISPRGAMFSPANLLALVMLCWSTPIALPSLTPAAANPVPVKSTMTGPQALEALAKVRSPRREVSTLFVPWPTLLER